MRVIGILEDTEDAANLLQALGWLAYATDSQGARAPPPAIDPEAPELPFTSEIDGIAYELEPWEQARRKRLQKYARQRDQVAGIVIYDGEWNETSGHPTEAEVWHHSIEESQASPFPDDIDQRPPPEWEAQQWDQSAQIWRDTQLAQWANRHTRDGMDPSLPKTNPSSSTINPPKLTQRITEPVAAAQPLGDEMPAKTR